MRLKSTVLPTLLLWVSGLLPIQAEPPAGFSGYWPLTDSADDASENKLHGTNHGVEFKLESLQGKYKSGQFSGRKEYIEIPDHETLDFEKGDFTVSLHFRTDERYDDVLGDLITKYDPATRRGFNIGLLDTSGQCTSMNNTRNLFFGIDDGSEPEWKDCGRPGQATLIYSLATYEGDLYASTFELGEGLTGRVYRYKGGQEWEDCGNPDACNAVTALAVFEGKLYAGVSRYNAGGSHLAASPNLADGGKVYRYEGGNKWVDCGRVGVTEFVYGLTVYRNRLYASLMDSPNDENRPDQGLYRYEGGTEWKFCGNPGGRVAAISVFNGYLFGTGYDGGNVGGLFRYEGGDRWTNYFAPPGVTQTYSYAIHNGRMHLGTWPDGSVFISEGPDEYVYSGRLGKELEVMGMSVYNGKLYGGTLPLAQVYRLDGETSWTLTGRLDYSDVEYRRAWSMGIWNGKLYCGVLPSGHVHGMQAGLCTSYDRAVTPGWHHLAAIRRGTAIELYLDGAQVAKAEGTADAFDLSNDAPLRVGFGAHDYFNGSMKDLAIYRRALGDEEIKALAK